MKKLATILAVTALSTAMIASPVMAEPHFVPTVKLTADLNYAFGDIKAQNLQLTEMDKQEMNETEGAWIPWVIGAVGILWAFPAHTPEKCGDIPCSDYYPK